MNYVITILLFMVSIVMVIFGAQNTQNVELNFLAYRSGNVPLSLVIVLATLGGALIVGLVSMLNSLRRSYRERGIRKKYERENRDLQQKVVALEQQLAASIARTPARPVTSAAVTPPADHTKPTTRH
jgi:uncharacterized integral membrane protein